MCSIGTYDRSSSLPFSTTLSERPAACRAEDAGPPEDPTGYSDCDATAHSGLMGRAEDAAVVGAAAIRAPRTQVTIFWPEP